ncbi:hypothetical protein KC327_g34 [Hortaea werneckii]|nr:hypothetical protein KC327_g34 [Hortaea werneckii]
MGNLGGASRGFHVHGDSLKQYLWEVTYRAPGLPLNVVRRYSGFLYYRGGQRGEMNWRERSAGEEEDVAVYAAVAGVLEAWESVICRPLHVRLSVLTALMMMHAESRDRHRTRAARRMTTEHSIFDGRWRSHPHIIQYRIAALSIRLREKNYSFPLASYKPSNCIGDAARKHHSRQAHHA